MMEFSILLEACDPERNRWRSYHIAAGQDLFGDWVVVLTYGRMGCRGRTKMVLMPDESAARRFVEACLRKRESAHKRIGIGYKVRQTSGYLAVNLETRDNQQLMR
jgi:predicted DNA-binding WGR domain protein